MKDFEMSLVESKHQDILKDNRKLKMFYLHKQHFLRQVRVEHLVAN